MPSRRFFTAIILLLAITIAASSGFQQRIALLSSPALNVGRYVAGVVAMPIQLLRGIGLLREELDSARHDIIALQSEIAALEIAQRENSLLREQLNAPTRKQFERTILANVIGRDPIGGEFTVIVNAGKRDGVQEQNPVVVPGGALIGRVVGVGDAASIVQLISHTDSRIDVRILPSGIRGVVEAQAGFLSVDILPQRFSFKEDETVVTTGADGLYPAGLYLGRLGEVLSEETDIFERRRLKNNQILETLTDVFILVQNAQ